LAQAYDRLGNNEAAVEASKQALGEWLAVLKKVQASEKEPRIGHDAQIAAVYVHSSALRMPAANAWVSLWGGYAGLESEEGLDWTFKKNQAWETAIKMAAGTPLAAKLDQIKQSAPDLMSRLPDLSTFRKFQACPGILSYFKKLFPLIPPGDVEFSVSALLLASACDPKKEETARSQMEHLDIVNTVKESWKSAQGPSNGMARVGFQKAIGDADTWMKLADRAEAGVLLSRWVSGLEPILAPVPGYHEYRPSLNYYKARALMLNGDAEGARELLVSIRREPYWSHAASSNFRQDVVHALIEVEVKLGHSEAALLGTEEARAERDRTRRLASGIVEGDPEGVELAMLLRQAALDENVDRMRVAELEQRAKISTAWKSPDLESLRAGIRTLPPDTTALVYFPLWNELAIWRIERNAPPKLVRVPITSDILLLAVRRFRASLASGEGGWESMARELYEGLIEPVGPIASGRTIAISGSNLLGNIPFEVLQLLPANHSWPNTQSFIWVASVRFKLSPLAVPYEVHWWSGSTVAV
jgi:hypothetical protein